MRAVKYRACPTPHSGVIKVMARTCHFDHTLLGGGDTPKSGVGGADASGEGWVLPMPLERGAVVDDLPPPEWEGWIPPASWFA
jgi:hypothetical protein